LLRTLSTPEICTYMIVSITSSHHTDTFISGTTHNHYIILLLFHNVYHHVHRRPISGCRGDGARDIRRYRSPGPRLFGAPPPPVASGPATRAHTLHPAPHGEKKSTVPSLIGGVGDRAVHQWATASESEGATGARNAAPRLQRRRRTTRRLGLGSGPEPGAGTQGRPTVQAVPVPVRRAQAQVQKRTAEEGGHGHVSQQVSRSTIK